MPPELLRGLSTIDYPAADMWALGVLTFCMLTGRDPFHNNTDQFPRRCLDDHQVSPDGRSFIDGLLQSSIAERLRSDQAVSHAWITYDMPDLPFRAAGHHM